MGKIEIYIGPNGYGKTHMLNDIKAGLISNGSVSEKDILFLDSELALLDEVKDTVDTSKTMEFILFELLQTPSYLAKRQALEEEIDALVLANQGRMNDIVDEILLLNGSVRTTNFIQPTKPEKKKLKGQVAIDAKDIKGQMGSGQKMQLLLSLVRESSKEYIFLDEPEKYSHPSMLNKTATIINGIKNAGKNLYIATHSPKLLSMIDFDFTDLYVINDSTHAAKPIDFSFAITNAKSLPVANYPKGNQIYYVSEKSLSDVVRRRHSRDFLEALFAKRVFVCEGVNDGLFINESLRAHNRSFEDFFVLRSFGKFNIPALADLLRSVDIEVQIMFDRDDEAVSSHKDTNEYFRANFSMLSEMVPCLEDEIGYKGKKSATIDFLDYVESMPTISDIWL